MAASSTSKRSRADDSGSAGAKRRRGGTVNPARVRTLNDNDIGDGPIMYWMSREHRAEDNWALLHAMELADARKQAVVVAFSLVEGFMGATARQFGFMLRGLEEVEASLTGKGISFALLRGECDATVPELANSGGFGAVVCDFSPVRLGRQWRAAIAERCEAAVLEVDAHNVVPAWVATDKLEYAARTIRPRIHKHLPEFLEEFPELPAAPAGFPGGPDTLSKLVAAASSGGADGAAAAAAAKPALPCGVGSAIGWAAVRGSVKADASVPEVRWLKPGAAAAASRLDDFLSSVRAYAKKRNDPGASATSLMSPYLHFGQISAQRAALAARAVRSRAPEAVDGFVEELVVRRELAENYVHYNPDGYDRIDGFYPQFDNDSWAQKSLREHAGDEREVLYTREQLERGETHDPLWNAAQAHMVHLGHMPGFNRMYWAKKVLEWTPSPEEALDVCVYLNDKYELDGRDPNGWVGCAWAIGGVHDNGWKERPVFGKIRYMNLASTRRKFDVEAYVDRVARLVREETGLTPEKGGVGAKDSRPGVKGKLWGLAGKRA